VISCLYTEIVMTEMFPDRNVISMKYFHFAT